MVSEDDMTHRDDLGLDHLDVDAVDLADKVITFI